jgi:hypothetical protein
VLAFLKEKLYNRATDSKGKMDCVFEGEARRAFLKLFLIAL